MTYTLKFVGRIAAALRSTRKRGIMNTYEVLVDDVKDGKIMSACDGYDFQPIKAENADEALLVAAEQASNPSCYNFEKSGAYEFSVRVRNVADSADKNGTFITVHYEAAIEIE